ncbi:MAG: 1-aminocyclopropane-1-carboxylate deaminase [Saprospiraceae bacterium]|jgi:1-aminocyclopropane-1-carboxylate deaminase
MIDSQTRVRIDKIENPFLKKHGITLYLQRDDLLHPEISGNKWRKLKYNIQEFKEGNYTQIATFGGAFSNHIAATAAAGKEFNVPTIGIIRGEKSTFMNPTLSLAKKNGMKLKFISRTKYKEKQEETFLQELQNEFPNSLIIPEGGANKNGVIGCTEIIKGSPQFDVVICACGTGGTLSGIIGSLSKTQYAIGIPVLKNAFYLNQEVENFLKMINCKNEQWELNFDYHLGGYAKFNEELHGFIEDFFTETKIKLDPIYTGKMMYGLYDLIAKNKLNNKAILAIHTGGIQGVKGYESRYNKLLF